jgi:hypothetical protein
MRINNHANKSFWKFRSLILLFISMLTMLIVPGVASASTQDVTVVGDHPLQGMLVSLEPNPNVATLADNNNAPSLLGIIVPIDETNIERQSGQSSVATDGIAKTLVSTLNGDIKVGDRITTSSIQGVGEKATGNSWIVGIAEASVDSSSKGLINYTVKDSNGKSLNVYLATIPVEIKVTYYVTNSPDSAQIKQNSLIPQSVQKTANSIAGKPVSAIALVAGLLISLAGVLVAGIIINAAIRNGFTAIARQPLTKHLVLQEQWKEVAVAIFVLLLALGGSVLILKFV